MKQLMFKDTLRILRGHVLDHVAAKIAVGLLILLGLAVFGHAVITEKPDPVSGTGNVAMRYNPKLWMGGMREAAYPSA